MVLMTNIVGIMAYKAPTLLPKVKRRLGVLGEQIRLARLRRNFTAAIVAERSSLTRETLKKIERGDPSVKMGSYCSVLHSLGLDADIELIGAKDGLGREIEDRKTLTRQRASSRSVSNRNLKRKNQTDV